MDNKKLRPKSKLLILSREQLRVVGGGTLLVVEEPEDDAKKSKRCLSTQCGSNQSDDYQN